MNFWRFFKRSSTLKTVRGRFGPSATAEAAKLQCDRAGLKNSFNAKKKRFICLFKKKFFFQFVNNFSV